MYGRYHRFLISRIWSLKFYTLHHTTPEARERHVATHTQCGSRPNRRTKKESTTSEGFASAVVDYVTPNLKTCRHNALLHIFEDNESGH